MYPRTVRKHRGPQILLLLALVWAGSRSSVAEPPSPRFSVEWLDSAQTNSILGGTNLTPLSAMEYQYRLVRKDHKKEFDTQIFTRDPQDKESPWRLLSSMQRIEHLGLDGSNNIVLAEVEELEHGDLVRFSPPLLRVPARLEPGVILTNECRMTVVKRLHPDDRVGHGSIVQTMAYRGRARLTTPAGVFDCVCIHDASVTHLSIASVTTDSERFLAPGIGLISERYHEHVQALWILHWNLDRLGVLDSSPKPHPEPIGTEPTR